MVEQVQLEDKRGQRAVGWPVAAEGRVARVAEAVLKAREERKPQRTVLPWAGALLPLRGEGRERGPERALSHLGVTQLVHLWLGWSQRTMADGELVEDRGLV